MELTKKKIIKYLYCLLIMGIWLIGLWSVFNKLTFVEYDDISPKSENFITLNRPGVSLYQEFISEYNLINGVQIKVHNFGKDSNSDWEVIFVDQTTSTVLYQWTFNASSTTNDGYYSLNMKFPIKVKKGGNYAIVIAGINNTEQTALGFYMATNDVYPEGKLFYDSRVFDGDLCVRVNGGDIDFFWPAFYILLSIGGVLVYCYSLRVKAKGKKILNDRIIQACLLGFLYFLVMFIFSKPQVAVFLDETDNLLGGIIIARGGVLYRDYVTQHTPFAYYLCSLYAKMGASSIQQFRLLFYGTLGVIWALIYIRNVKLFGAKKMACIPFLIVVILSTQENFWVGLILSDAIQGVAFAALLFEYLGYLEDNRIDFKRSAIISLAFFSSFMSAFVSIYPLAATFIAVVIHEIRCHIGIEGKELKLLLKRYIILVVTCLIPFIISILYFTSNHALMRMYDMAFKFNTQVYSEYYNNFGKSVLTPVLLAFQYQFEAYANTINSLFSGGFNTKLLVGFIMILASNMCILKMIFQGKWFKGISLFVIMTLCATRGIREFHATTYWYLLIIIAALFFELPELVVGKNMNWKTMVAIILVVCTSQPYITTFSSKIFEKETVVSEWEHMVVERAKPDEKVFIDFYRNGSPYLFYKGVYPVNRLTYLLPWYMDWYEQETIEDLILNKPEMVIYQPDTTVWGETNFLNALNDVIQRDYEKLSDHLQIYIRRK